MTPDLNGCAVFVSGGLVDPTVVHVNSQPDILDKGEPVFTPIPHATSNKEINAAAAAFGAEFSRFKRTYKNPMWDGIYQALAGKLISLGLIPSARLKMLLPTDYLAEDVGSAAAFGNRDGGGWKFFVNAKNTTRQFWP